MKLRDMIVEQWRQASSDPRPEGEVQHRTLYARKMMFGPCFAELAEGLLEHHVLLLGSLMDESPPGRLCIAHLVLGVLPGMEATVARALDVTLLTLEEADANMKETT